MTDTLRIDTGEKHIAITNANGDVRGEIVFNPADVLFAERFYKVVGEFDVKLTEYQSRYEEVGKDTDEHGVLLHAENNLQLLRETCEYIRGQIDYLFGEGTSQIAFGDAMVLNMFEQFFDGITPFIQTARVQKISQYMPPPNGNGKKSRKRKAK
jgi:hypothetical protein